MSAYIYAALAAVGLLLGGLLWFKGHQLDKANAQNVQLRVQLISVAQANADQKAVIDQLTAANADWAAKAVLHAKEYKAALLDLSTANVVRNALQKALMVKESTDRQSVACQALLGLSIAKVCPQIAEDMQSRAK